MEESSNNILLFSLEEKVVSSEPREKYGQINHSLLEKRVQNKF